MFCSALTAQKMKFFNKVFFGKRDQICKTLRIWSHLLKESLMENFIFVQGLLFIAEVEMNPNKLTPNPLTPGVY